MLPKDSVFQLVPIFWMLTWVYNISITAAPMTRLQLNNPMVTTSGPDRYMTEEHNITRFIPLILSKQPYRINEPDVCSGGSSGVFLIVFVCSAVNQTSQRNAIRKTWASVTYKRNQLSDGYVDGVQVMFITGLPSREKHQKNDMSRQESILEESKQYGDIIQGNFIDSYHNLSLKSMLMLRWASTYCASAKFILKVDDDTFVDMRSLVTNLQFTVNHHFVMGRMISGAQPFHDKNSKYYTPSDVYRGATYPQYLSGSAYVISTDGVKRLLLSCLRTRVFWLEDVYITGMCAKKANVTLIHNTRFNSFSSPDADILLNRIGGSSSTGISSCWKSKLTTLHRLSVSEMKQLWELYQQQC